jgi:hypothetical protein
MERTGEIRPPFITTLGDKMMVYARWVALLPAVLAAWYAAVFIGVAVLNYVESLCPPELMISGMCTAEWFPRAEKAVFCLATAVSAVLVVLSAALVAPFQKIRTAWSIFAVGSAVAILWGVEGEAWLELVSTLVAGGIAVMVVRTVVAQPGAPADGPRAARSARG